jgi:LmbE family N-acetylglucosaminyl deacetylase
LETAAQATSIFISPHLDDVVLSCGGTLAHLARRRAEVILVTVFTADSANEAQLSPLARQLHQEWNEDSHPFRLRRQEDRAVAERLGIKYRWLGFLDAIYRDPDLQDSGELFLTEFDPRSDPCFEPVRDAIWQLVNEHPGAIVFAPLGLGHHRDHLLVHHVLQDVKAMTSAASEYYYYEDYPYAAKADLRARLAELDWEAKPLSIDIADTFQERVRLITMHASQLSILFDDPDSVYERVMAYATRVGTKGKPRERFWSARAGSQQNGAGPGWSGR